MSVDVTIPQSGESIREVQVGAWRKAVGDRVAQDEILVQIETDKAAMDLPAPVSGVLREILKKQGDEATVGEVIARIEEGPPPPPAPRGSASQSPQPAMKSADAGRQPAAKPSDAAPVMPAAQRLMAQQGVSAGAVTGTGPGGRVLKEDVERHVAVAAEGPGAPAGPSVSSGDAPAPATSQGHGSSAPSSAGERPEDIVPMSPMRKVIAKNLVAAQHAAALLTTFNEADMSAVVAMRQRYQEAFQSKYGIKLGFMSFFVKAAIEALKLVPQVNAEIRDTSIVYKRYYDIGVAIGGGRGLVVPVVRSAERLSFAEIEKTIAEFARRAKENKIELSELKGGTFTISNGGIYGSMLSTPIVNAPQSGILGLHAIQDRPAAVGGQVVVRPMMYLALTYDHRIVDGREAVTFLRHIKDLIEDPARILIEI